MDTKKAPQRGAFFIGTQGSPAMWGFFCCFLTGCVGVLRAYQWPGAGNYAARRQCNGHASDRTRCASDRHEAVKTSVKAVLSREINSARARSISHEAVKTSAKAALSREINSAKDLSGHATQWPERWRHLNFSQPFFSQCWAIST